MGNGNGNAPTLLIVFSCLVLSCLWVRVCKCSMQSAGCYWIRRRRAAKATSQGNGSVGVVARVLHWEAKLRVPK
jgi:hypothetical protein